MNISLHHRISPVVTSNTSMGSGAYSMLLERAVSIPPDTRSIYCRTEACAIFVRRRPTRMTSTATAASASASSGSKGTVTATNAIRHRLYSVMLVRNPRMIFLLTGSPPFRNLQYNRLIIPQKRRANNYVLRKSCRIFCRRRIGAKAVGKLGVYKRKRMCYNL